MSKRKWLYWTVITLCLVYILSSCEVTITKTVETQQPTPVQVQVVSRSCDSRLPYYDIALSNELQSFTKNQAIYQKVPYELVLAVMQRETGFQTDVVSETNDYGIMQINKSNHAEMKELFGYEDLMKPENNIVCGIYILSNCYEKYGHDLNRTLMAYNMGDAKAEYYWSQGIYETEYSKGVIEIYETYRTGKVNGRR